MKKSEEKPTFTDTQQIKINSVQRASHVSSAKPEFKDGVRIERHLMNHNGFYFEHIEVESFKDIFAHANVTSNTI
jgi:hypothetical protein